MTMHVNLSVEMESYIKGKVSSGFYGNATEVIRDAIRRMQADEERATAFRRAVAEGEAQLERGQGRDFTAKRLDELAETARRKLRSGAPIDPDVLP